MQQHGITQGQVARRAGVDPSHLSRWLLHPPKKMAVETMLTIEESVELIIAERAALQAAIDAELGPCES